MGLIILGGTTLAAIAYLYGSLLTQVTAFVIEEMGDIELWD